MNPVPTNVKVVVSSLTKCTIVLVGTFSCVKKNGQKAREREFAKILSTRTKS